MAKSLISETEAVEILRGIIDKLEENERKVEQLEAGDKDHRIATFDGWSNISAAREWLRRAEDVLGTLKSRPAPLETRVSEYRARLPKLTIESLPDEILGVILGIALLYHRGLSRCSLTCSRFHSVILSTPSIWADIWLAASMPPHFIETIAQRSGSIGLIVHIASWHLNRQPSSERLVSLTTMFSLSHRWVDVAVNIDEGAAKLVRSSFPSPNLDSVHTFQLSCNKDSDTCYFYQDWSMPNLQHLIILKAVPSLSSRLMRDASILKECNVDIDLAPEVSEIVSFLAATPNLTRLQLTLVDLRDSTQQSENRIASLSNLEYLKFTSRDSIPGSISWLLASISSPRLEEIYLEPQFHTEDERDEAISDYRAVAQHIRERYPSLKSFELVLCSIRYKSAREEVKNLIDLNFFDDILWQLPSTITKITLKIAQLRLISWQGGNFEDGEIPTLFYPNLKELNIEECSYIGYYSFYKDLSDYLRQSGVTLDTFLPSRYPYNDFVEEDEVEGLMEEARATMRNSGCWTG